MSRATSSKASWMINSIRFEELTVDPLLGLRVCSLVRGQTRAVRPGPRLESTSGLIHSPVAFHQRASFGVGKMTAHVVTGWKCSSCRGGLFEKKVIERDAGSVIFYRDGCETLLVASKRADHSSWVFENWKGELPICIRLPRRLLRDSIALSLLFR